MPNKPGGRKPAYPLVLTSPYVSGPSVKVAQRALAKNPFGNFYDGEIDGEYGELTAQATYRAKYWVGYKDANLSHAYGEDLHRFLTGEAKTTAAQNLRRRQRRKASRSKPMAEQALAEAIRWIGTKESPPNSNYVEPFIPWWGKTEWGYVVRFPWCAVFTSYCYIKVGSKAFDPKRGLHRYVPYIVADARAGRNGLVLVSSGSVNPGNLVCFDWDGGVADHVGLFEKWVVPGKTFRSVEGNTSGTNAGSQSNGGMVAGRERRIEQVECFVKVTY
jgi:hypothetical protein